MSNDAPWVSLGKAAVEAAERGELQKARELGIEAWDARLKAYAAARAQQEAQTSGGVNSPWGSNSNGYIDISGWDTDPNDSF
jgi:hypothetical protein